MHQKAKAILAGILAAVVAVSIGLAIGFPKLDATHTAICEVVHNSYRTTGPDGRFYATWHPPSVTLAGFSCHFGHEHGDDPRTSTVNASMPPFDYVNTLAGRSELHSGFKVYVVNDDGRGGRFRFVVHQGSSSNNAYAENRHELLVDYVNDDGRELHAMLLGHFGPSGKFKAGCGGNVELVTVAPPTNDVTEGERVIPDEECFAEGRLPYELWGSSNNIVTAEGRALATFKAYFTILNPSRFYLPSAPGGVGRSDLKAATGRSPLTRDSLYKGTQREVYQGILRVANQGGPSEVWTDADGKVQPGPCPTCIKQYICASSISKDEPIVVFRTVLDYDDGWVRIPN